MSKTNATPEALATSAVYWLRGRASEIDATVDATPLTARGTLKGQAQLLRQLADKVETTGDAHARVFATPVDWRCACGTTGSGYALLERHDAEVAA